MVTDQVAAVAKAHGVELVLTREELDTPNTTDTTKQMQATLQQILNRKVVYSDPTLDVTDEVLKKLDASSRSVVAKRGWTRRSSDDVGAQAGWFEPSVAWVSTHHPRSGCKRKPASQRVRSWVGRPTLQVRSRMVTR